MKAFHLSCYLFILLTVHESLQHPVATSRPDVQAQHHVEVFAKSIGHPDPTKLSFSELLRSKPGGRRDTTTAVGFAHVFASLPEIIALDHLEGEQYIRKVMELRKGIENDPVARVNFRRAIVNHMEANNIISRTITAVNDLYGTLNMQMYNRENLAKYKAINPEKIKADNAATSQRRKKERRMKREGRQQAASSSQTARPQEMTFEQLLAAKKIAKNADAFTIEEASRDFPYKSRTAGTIALKMYLRTRFKPEVAALAISRRRMERRRATHLASVRAVRKMKASGGLKQHPESGSQPSAKKARAMNTQKQPSSSAVSKLPSSPPKDILSGEQPFEDSDWWEDLFR